MADPKLDRKGTLWPWILAAIIVLVLIWLLIKAFDVGVDTVPTAATAPVTAADTATPGNEAATTPASTADASAETAAATERHAGVYRSSNAQLALDADGTYSMRETPSGEVRGTWTHDASANVLRLKPDDGTDERHLRIESNDTLVPLDTSGAPAGLTAPLTRQPAP